MMKKAIKEMKDKEIKNKKSPTSCNLGRLQKETPGGQEHEVDGRNRDHEASRLVY